MPILNIELSEYDALRDRVKQLECENRNLSEAKSQFYKDMANRIQSQEQQEIRELKEQLKRSQEHLDSSLGRIDRLMKRNWWDRLWNRGVE